MNPSESSPPSSEPPPGEDEEPYRTTSLVVDTTDSVTRLLSVLADEEPRLIIYALFRKEKTTVPLTEITQMVAAAVDGDTESVRERIVRVHLPNLGFLGIVDYDLAGDPRVWLSENVDIVNKRLLHDVVERIERYECS
ncbi:hypothetical protein A4G99_17595 [Haladaptatus sp. R4]|uniref:hypothetical protein n=1 Tax=Haladaptatus sp. R4 TaxID=1679489 RepID=UPI0007B4BEF0|nr:hypothetical protein [Haladaptatus sp. R4]KZN22908.1 hypothetical protein A4G99_17595 [Haladaptatus sp. R4]